MGHRLLEVAGFFMLALVAQVASAQSPVTVTDPSGGVTPAANYSPSTGGSFTSWQAALSSMRSAVPDNLGQFVSARNKQDLSSTKARIFFDIKRQQPVNYEGLSYQFLELLDAPPFCPGSATTYGTCLDEAELIAGYISQTLKPGVEYTCGWSKCVNSNPRVEGGYLPFDKSDTTTILGTGVLSDSTRSNARAIVWEKTSYYQGVPTVVTVRRPLYRSQRYVCRQGMVVFKGTGPDVIPYLCQNGGLYSITIQNLRQKCDGCDAVSPRPLFPSSTDKARAETDFTFAGRSFVRYYHSLREEVSPNFRMGPTWTHTYGSRLLMSSGNAFALVDGGNQWDTQHVSGYVKFIVPKKGNALLEKLPDSTWRLTSRGGDVSTFSSSGRLISIQNPSNPGGDVILEYNAAGRLERIVDSAGRALQFTYDWYGTLTGATLPDGQQFTYGYDAHGNLITVQSSEGTKQYHYGESGLATNGDPELLTGITYEDGQRYASFGYDVHGRAVLSTLHGAGGQAAETTRVHYSGLNSAQVTTSDGAVRTYTFNNDPNRRPLSIGDSSGTTTFTYDGYGRTLTSTDGRGVQTRYTYTTGNQTAAISAYGTTVQRTEQTDWHATLNLPTERRTLNATGAVVAKTNWTYNARGQVLTTTQTDPVSGAARSSTNTYCEQAGVDGGTCPRVGLLLSVDGARTGAADTTGYSYYASDDPACASAPATCSHRKGDLWKVTDAFGHISEILAYDAESRPTSVKDANGIITETTYHPRGWLTSRTVKGASPADDRSMLIDYWPTGLVKRVTQADGSYTEYAYDTAKRLTGIEDSAGNAIHYTLDNAGNRTGEETRDPNGALTRSLSRVYDQLGRLQSQADAYSQATGYTYDANGNTDVVTDSLGRGTDNAYDPLNRLTQTLQDVGGIAATTLFKYDAQDNLTRVTDPKGLNTDYTYNGLGDLTQLNSPDTGVTAYTYDSAGNRSTQTDARGVTATYGYDVLNRLTGIAYPTTSLDVAYQYDTVNASCVAGETFAKGRLTGIVDGSGSTHYCYSRFGELTRKVQATNGHVFVTRYHYNAAGRLASQTYPDGAVLDAVRDGEGRVVQLGITPNGGSRQVVLTGATYAPFGPSTGWTYGNGRLLQRSLNQNYQPLAINDSATGGLSLRFGFDAVGNLTQLEDAAQTQVLAQYGYDALNRLQQTKDGPTGTPIETYAYDATGNRQSVTHAGVTTAYAYPGSSHRLTSAGGVARTYDTAGNTTGLGTGTGYAYSDAGRMELVTQGSTVQAQYAYNGKGEQVRRWQGVDNAYFVYDEAGHLLGEYASDGSPKQQVLWFGDLPVGVLAGSGAGQQLHYIEPDHLGTPRVVIDGVRNVPIWEWKLTGEAFGATPPNQDPDADGTPFVFDLRFPGQRYDSATGLNYNYFRDYDPSTGRYVESDPIGLLAGLSTYAYVGGAPLRYKDPMGLCKCTADYRGTYTPGSGERNWLGRKVYGVTCDYYCTNDDGQQYKVRGTRIVSFWFEEGYELSCAGVQYKYNPLGPPNYMIEGAKEFDPKSSDVPELKRWANAYCSSCR